MDKLSMALISTAINDHVGGQLLNHLCYADDMCPWAPAGGGARGGTCPPPPGNSKIWGAPKDKLTRKN